MKKEDKAILIDKIKDTLAQYSVVYLAETTALNAERTVDLRRAAFKAGIKMMVVKNTLLSRAAEMADLNGLQPTLEGTTAIATSDDDYTAAARILSNFAKKSKTFEIKAGYLDGSVVDLATIDSLAKLPSREILLANVLGAFQAPIASFARAIQAIVDDGGIEACLAKKSGAAASEAPAEEAAPAEAAAE